MILPAITLWQPYASLIAIGAKPYETRSFKAPDRLLCRRVAIHAAARKPDPDDVSPEIHDAMFRATGRLSWFKELPLGAVVCTAVLAESIRAERVIPDAFGNYEWGRWAWRLDDVRPVDPVAPAKGRQMIGWPWNVPEGVLV